MEKFTHDRIKDYIKWLTKFGSIKSIFGVETNKGKKLLLKGLDRDVGEEIPFGHFFPDETKNIHELFSQHVVRAPDFYCRKVQHAGVLKRFPHIRYHSIFLIEGNKVKQAYNPMNSSLGIFSARWCIHSSGEIWSLAVQGFYSSRAKERMDFH